MTERITFRSQRECRAAPQVSAGQGTGITRGLERDPERASGLFSSRSERPRSDQRLHRPPLAGRPCYQRRLAQCQKAAHLSGLNPECRAASLSGPARGFTGGLEADRFALPGGSSAGVQRQRGIHSCTGLPNGFRGWPPRKHGHEKSPAKRGSNSQMRSRRGH
jgi:hypothetical protein